MINKDGIHSCIHLPTCVEESVGVSPDDDVDSVDLLGDLLVHGETRVTQSDDLIDSQRLKFVHMQLQGAHLILEPQVWTCGGERRGERTGERRGQVRGLLYFQKH